MTKPLMWKHILHRDLIDSNAQICFDGELTKIQCRLKNLPIHARFIHRSAQCHFSGYELSFALNTVTANKPISSNFHSILLVRREVNLLSKVRQETPRRPALWGPIWPRGTPLRLEAGRSAPNVALQVKAFHLLSSTFLSQISSTSFVCSSLSDRHLTVHW